MLLTINRKSIVANFAKWLILQSPYRLPDNLVATLDYLYVMLDKVFQDADQFGYIHIQDVDLRVKLNEIFEDAQFAVYNERKNGNQRPYSFTSRFSQPDPDDDFISLSALARNIVQELEKDQK